MISERYGITLDRLRLWNNLGPKDLIYPCTKFRIVAPPKERTGNAAPSSNSGGTYRIIPGVSYTNAKGGSDIQAKGGAGGSAFEDGE